MIRQAAEPRRGELESQPGSVEDQLARAIDTSSLAKVVPHLPAEALHQIVRHRGVENSGELLVAATPAQLGAVLDLDLWRSPHAGLDEQFDVARFAEWLEGLVQAGDELAAIIVSRMDHRLVVTGLSNYVRVFDPAALAVPGSSDDEEPGGEMSKRAGLWMDIGGYVVQARHEGSWDAIVAVLSTLATDHTDFFREVMRGCRRLSNSRPELDGLDDLMSVEGQWQHDIALSRAHRREHKGFLAPAEARAFLHMARQPQPEDRAEPAMNSIAAAFLDDRDEADGRSDADGARQAEPVAVHHPENEVRETLKVVTALAAQLASPLSERPRALIGGTAAGEPHDSRVHALMEAVRVSDPVAFSARSREIAFLANALMAGCSIHARSFTPQEASDAALACCNLGLELSSQCAELPEAYLSEHDLLTAFQRGWAALHEASLFVARRLVEALRHVQSLDTKTHQGLVILRRQLEKCCAAGTPWDVRDDLDVLAILDTVAWTGLLGALDHCPVIPDALAAIVEHRKGPVSATAFAFVSSTRQIETMRAFAERLEEIFYQ